MSQHITNNQNIQPAITANYSEGFAPAFISEMAGYGLHPDSLITDGNIHRFSADGKKHKPDEWYIAFDVILQDGKHGLICTYGSWSSGEKRTYCSWNNNNSYSQEDLTEFRKIQKQKAAEAEKKIKEERDKDALEAARVWEAAAQEPPSPEYMRYVELKGVKPIGIRFINNLSGHPSIIIPFKNIDGNIRALEYISYDQQNKKKYPRCFGSRTDCFHVVDNLSIKNGDAITVAEGWATAVSIYMAVGGVVLAVGGTNNIENVVGQLKQRYPESSITIAGDLERGEQPARLTASKYNCNVVFPQFPQDKNFDVNKKAPYTDFNDLHKACGLEEVANQIILTLTIKRDLALNALIKKEDPCGNFSVKDLPPALSNYIASLCCNTEAHPIIITAAVLTEISAFFGTKVYTNYFGAQYPNLWILCIAGSGQLKTTALNLGSKYAREKQSAINREIKECYHKLKVATGTEQLTLKENIAHLECRDVILPNKITGEALLEHLSKVQRGAIFISEFGAWLQSFLKSNNSDLKATFTELYDVPSNYRYKTKVSGDFVLERPYISICGVSALPWVREEIKPSDTDSGFFARFLIFTPPHSDKIPKGRPEQFAQANLEAEESYRKTLDTIMRRLNSNNDSLEMTLSDEAWDFFCNDDTKTGLYYTLYTSIRGYNDKCRDVLAIYIKRWIPYLIKLSMIMELFINPDSKEISYQSIYYAYKLLLPAIKSTACLFEEELGESEFQRKCREFKEWIYATIRKTKKSISFRTITQSNKFGPVKEYEDVLQLLEESGQVSCTRRYSRGKERIVEVDLPKE